ncbi:amidohydrolase [Kribbella flavida DSM 17836]|uniref:Amidohydrolase n=1 Tax=Kribbella flavida (strain DSM 17836 / JCM 10339 / NBRC 14399) TaxID=479435 RepID=D2PZN1_KRIFD|nr:amidohydrolase family protein [Kribbella flavida]ADB35597.1 amidohydrolase [Kribbella flavida DSM 17836]
MSQQLPRRAVLIGGMAAGIAGPWRSKEPRPGESGSGDRSLAITHVDVIDCTQPRPRRDMTVLIDRGRICAVDRSGALPVPSGFTVVGGRGKFLIPGLADMHVHSPAASVRITPSLHLANGVTSVREMAGTPEIHRWRKAIERGELLGPRWTVGSEIVDGYPSLLLGPGETEGAIVVKDAGDVRAALHRIRRSGADFVKIYSRVSPAAFRALMTEARRTGLSVAGHLPDGVTVTEAVRSGLSTIEHLQALGCAISTDAVWARLAAVRIAAGDYASWFRQLHPIEYAAMTQQDPSRRSRLLDLLAEAGTFVDPTLTMHLTADRPEDVDTDDPRLVYIPQETRDFWTYGLEEIYLAGRTPREISEQRRLYDLRLDLVARMQATGVRLLAGTEAGFIYSYPGFGMHDELVELERAGLTPWQALRAATLTPAEALGRADDLGTVERGKFADLVLLGADPLATTANLRRIDSVVAGGRLITPTMRQQLLADAKRAAGAADANAGYHGGCGCHLPRQRPAAGGDRSVGERGHAAALG